MDRRGFLFVFVGECRHKVLCNGQMSEKAVTETKFKGITAYTFHFLCDKNFIYLPSIHCLVSKPEEQGTDIWILFWSSGENGIGWRHKIPLQLL